LYGSIFKLARSEYDSMTALRLMGTLRSN